MSWRTGRKIHRTIYGQRPDGAEVLVGVMDTPELARLAAAAPDLLDVAEDLVRQVEEFGGWDEADWPAALACLRAHAKAARAAIAKATADVSGPCVECGETAEVAK